MEWVEMVSEWRAGQRALGQEQLERQGQDNLQWEGRVLVPNSRTGSATDYVTWGKRLLLSGSQLPHL